MVLSKRHLIELRIPVLFGGHRQRRRLDNRGVTVVHHTPGSCRLLE